MIQTLDFEGKVDHEIEDFLEVGGVFGEEELVDLSLRDPEKEVAVLGQDSTHDQEAEALSQRDSRITH